jgi:hypothetical protein
MGDVTRGRNFSWPTKPCSAVDGWDYDLSGGMYHTIVSEVNLPISFFFKEKFIRTPRKYFKSVCYYRKFPSSALFIKNPLFIQSNLFKEFSVSLGLGFPFVSGFSPLQIEN